MSEMSDRIDAVEARIQSACDRAARSRDSVQLVAVSKRKPIESVQEAIADGLDVFGENRVQEAMQKIPAVSGVREWHLIGPLQSNKVRPAILCNFSCIHSVHSLELLERINRIASEEGREQAVLLQVNIAGEGTKNGLSVDEVFPVLETAAGFMNISVDGLMTLPPFKTDPDDVAPYFADLRELRDQAALETGFPLPVLSMGMSHDLEVAIREGASHVRVGTDIFGARTA